MVLAAALEAKIELAQDMLDRAMDRFGPALALAWTGGKDSTLLLWLAREACMRSGRPLPEIITIDEGDPFPEMERFQAALATAWELHPTTLRCAELLDRGLELDDLVTVASLSPPLRSMVDQLGFTAPIFPLDPETPLGNQLLKVAPLTAFLRRRGPCALAVAIRADEHPARASEQPESPREDPPHLRLHPLLDFTEADVWATIQGRDIPFCELYTQGYRSLGTRRGTHRAGDIPAWEQDLTDRSGERAGRAQDKEAAMAQLRALGYM